MAAGVVTRIPTSMSETEVARLVELAHERIVLECGTYLGHSAVAMARTAKIVHTVDWHRGDPHAGDEDTLHPYLWNLEYGGVRDAIVPHVGRFEIVLPALREGYFTFAFLDGYHTTEATGRDLDLVKPLLVPGSLIAVHDYGDERFGVAAAVDERGPLVELTETLAVIAA